MSVRAFTPKEIQEKKLEIDIDYYKTSQILPVIERMTYVLTGISLKTIAESLGIDPSKYKSTV